MATPAEIQNPNNPTAALIGRVNVGKSTLFNKLIEKNQAIVSDTPGTTRTSNIGTLLWQAKESTLIDTGGLTFQDDIPLEKEIIAQTTMAIERADVLILVTDGTSNTILPQEKEIAQIILASGKPYILVANKIDNQKKEIAFNIGDWFALGLGEPLYIAASSGRGIGDFLDVLYDMYTTQDLFASPETIRIDEKKSHINISLIGKPNVGKSSLFNKLIGEEEVIVSELAHTTREPHHTNITYKYTPKDSEETTPYDIRFIDTAGIRRKNKVSGALERMGIGKSINQIEESDIVLLVLDGSEPISSQDKQLAGLLERRSKSVLILINKWDLSEDTSFKAKERAKELTLYHLPHLKFAPILFVSGLTGLKVHDIFPEIIAVWKGRHTHIANRALEQFLKQVTAYRLPTKGKGTNHPKLLGMRQINEAPPIFELYIKSQTSLHRSYLNYLQNRLREQYDFTGTPIVIKLTKVKR